MLTLGIIIEIGRDDSQKLFKEVVFMSHHLTSSHGICEAKLLVMLMVSETL